MNQTSSKRPSRYNQLNQWHKTTSSLTKSGHPGGRWSCVVGCRNFYWILKKKLNVCVVYIDIYIYIYTNGQFRLMVNRIRAGLSPQGGKVGWSSQMDDAKKKSLHQPGPNLQASQLVTASPSPVVPPMESWQDLTDPVAARFAALGQLKFKNWYNHGSWWVNSHKLGYNPYDPLPKLLPQDGTVLDPENWVYHGIPTCRPCLRVVVINC